MNESFKPDYKIKKEDRHDPWKDLTDKELVEIEKIREDIVNLTPHTD